MKANSVVLALTPLLAASAFFPPMQDRKPGRYAVTATPLATTRL